mgnify:CR=1 FL=1
MLLGCLDTIRLWRITRQPIRIFPNFADGENVLVVELPRSRAAYREPQALRLGDHQMKNRKSNPTYSK